MTAPDELLRRGPKPRAAGVVATQVMTAGSGATGKTRVEVPDLLGARIGGQRAELRVGGGHTVERQDLGIRAEDRQAPGQQAQLARRVRSGARLGFGGERRG